jgi:DNA replication protein DnaC
MTTIDTNQPALEQQLNYLKLYFFRDNYDGLAKQAAHKQWTHVHYLTELTNAEADQRRDRATLHRIRQARFPQIKTLEQFKWNWPKKINPLQVKNLFRLNFIQDKSNVVFLGGVGLGKTHLATALGYQLCLKGHSVLFTTAVDVLNSLLAAQTTGRLKQELKKYRRPSVLILDELGYLPIDKTGADLMFQIISQRYEQGSIIITTNRAFKDWPKIFNNDATLTSALLDRLLHHTETVIIEGKSYRMKDVIEN